MSNPYSDHVYDQFHLQNPHFVTGGGGYCNYRSSSHTSQEIDDYARKVTPSGNSHVIRQYLGNSGSGARYVSTQNAYFSVSLQTTYSAPWNH